MNFAKISPFSSFFAISTITVLCFFGLPVAMAESKTQIPPVATSNHIKASLKVMSLNLAHGRKKSLNQLLVSTARTRENISDISTVLNREKIDVVALQEADGPSRWSGKFDHVALLSNKAAYPARAHSLHAQNWIYNYGTALISKSVFTETIDHTFAPTPPTTNKGFTLGQISWQVSPSSEDVKLVDIISVHLDFSRKEVREQQIAEMVSVLEHREYPAIIMGDFNSDWLADDRVVRELADQANLHTYSPEALNMGTYPRSSKRLDWILISEELEFLDYKTLSDVLSDHLAVIATVRIIRP